MRAPWPLAAPEPAAIFVFVSAGHPLLAMFKSPTEAADSVARLGQNSAPNLATLSVHDVIKLRLFVYIPVPLSFRLCFFFICIFKRRIAPSRVFMLHIFKHKK